jgi:hypothetical protein
MRVVGGYEFAVPADMAVETVIEYPGGLSPMRYQRMDYLALFSISDGISYQTPVFAIHLPMVPVPGTVIPIGRNAYFVQYMEVDGYDTYHLGLFSGFPEGAVLNDINHGLALGQVRYPDEIIDVVNYPYIIGPGYGDGFGLADAELIWAAEGLAFAGAVIGALAFEAAEEAVEALADDDPDDDEDDTEDEDFDDDNDSGNFADTGFDADDFGGNFDNDEVG